MPAIVDAARGCIGARFRPQGRDPAHGLDCVGLAGIAFGRGDLPRNYALWGGDARRIAALVESFGLRRVDDAASGDLVMLRTGPKQFHLAVMTGSGFVHADARLRRVVETPGRPPWPVIGIWREG
jgi:lipoprotein Spr